MTAIRTVVWLLCGGILGGCQTPGAVYELADKTSANAGIFQQHLGEMAVQSKAFAGRRADHIATMDAFNADLDSYLKRELYMRQKAAAAGDWPKIEALMKELTSLRDELVAIENGANFAQQERRANVLALYSDLSTFQTPMRDAANSLNALAKQESGAERAAFLGKFLVDVRKSLSESLAGNDAAAKAAQALLDKIKADLKSATQGDADGQE